MERVVLTIAIILIEYIPNVGRIINLFITLEKNPTSATSTLKSSFAAVNLYV